MKKISFIIVFLVLVLAGTLAWWINGSLPVNPHDTSKKAFSIKRGEGVRTIANNLKSEGLIKDPVIFYLLIRRFGYDSKIQAGDFILSPSQSALDIAKELQTGTYDIRIVVPEGKRAQEIADILKDRVDSYDESWNSKLALHEGYLFPDTYSFSKDVAVEQIISTMRDNFEKKYQTLGSSNLTKEEIVVLASMVEREAKHDVDRPLVASVLLNRYKIGMKLDIDATVQYATGTPKDWWPTLNDSPSNIAPNSPYNTYTHSGLTPTPISNPGLEALKAVVNPASTQYLFYITDKNGVNRYAKTNDEHEENKRRYGL